MLQPVSARYGDPIPFLGPQGALPGHSGGSPAWCDRAPPHPIASSADSFTSLCHLSARATEYLMGALGDPLDLTESATALGSVCSCSHRTPWHGQLAGRVLPLALPDHDGICQLPLSLPDRFPVLGVLETVNGPPALLP